MIIGLTFDLKQSVRAGKSEPEDALEEYDSPETIDALAAVCAARGHDIVKLGGGRVFLDNVQRHKVDFVFNIAEGLGNFRSREAQVPGVLEMLDIPYSGSDPTTLAISLDKALAKKLAALAGVPTPRWQIVSSSAQLSSPAWDTFPFPAFLKPAFEGSSKGIRTGSRVASRTELAAQIPHLLQSYRQPVMVEQYIDGDEITVGVIGNAPPKIIGVMRVLPRQKTPYFVYSLEVKRDWQRLVDYECPARLEPGLLGRLESLSLKVFEALSCRDIARVDFRISRDGEPYFLEVNPLPGLNPTSGDIVIMAKKMGYSYESLVSAILEAAVARYPCLRE